MRKVIYILQYDNIEGNNIVLILIYSIYTRKYQEINIFIESCSIFNYSSYFLVS